MVNFPASFMLSKPLCWLSIRCTDSTVQAKIVFSHQQVFMNEATCFPKYWCSSISGWSEKKTSIIKQTVNSRDTSSSKYWQSELWHYLHFMYSLLGLPNNYIFLFIKVWSASTDSVVTSILSWTVNIQRNFWSVARGKYRARKRSRIKSIARGKQYRARTRSRIKSIGARNTQSLI